MSEVDQTVLWAFLINILACQLVLVTVEVIRLIREIIRAFRGK